MLASNDAELLTAFRNLSLHEESKARPILDLRPLRESELDFLADFMYVSGKQIKVSDDEWAELWSTRIVSLFCKVQRPGEEG